MTTTEILERLSDRAALAITMNAEGRGDWREGNSSVEERIAIGCVIRNRFRTPRRFGRTYKAVCVQRLQFSCWSVIGGDANYRRTIALAGHLVSGAAIELPPIERGLFNESIFLAEGIIAELLLDRVNGATHYYAPAAMVPKGAEPAWAKGRQPCAIVGSQRFYLGV